MTKEQAPLGRPARLFNEAVEEALRKYGEWQFNRRAVARQAAAGSLPNRIESGIIVRDKKGRAAVTILAAYDIGNEAPAKHVAKITYPLAKLVGIGAPVSDGSITGIRIEADPRTDQLIRAVETWEDSGKHPPYFPPEDVANVTAAVGERILNRAAQIIENPYTLLSDTKLY